MRIYEGQIYSLSSAVEPECRGFHCEFLHISSPRIAFVHYGNGRFLQVGANSRMCLSTRDAHGKRHYKLVKIPFVKVGDRLEFDYPAYLKASGIAFRVYPDADIYGSDDSNYHMIYSKNAWITSGGYWQIDYNVYWLGIQYLKPLLYLNGKRVTYLQAPLPHPGTEQITAFIKAHWEEKHALSYAELAAAAARFRIRLDNCDTQVRFSDGTILRGSEIDWSQQ